MVVVSFKTIGRSIAMPQTLNLPYCCLGTSVQFTQHPRLDKGRVSARICAANETGDTNSAYKKEDRPGWLQQVGTLIQLTDRISQTARVALRTCAYISTIGAVALFFPDCIIRICSFMSRDTASLAVDPVLVRIGGCLAILFGAYYCGAAIDDMQGNQPRYFYISTVLGRYFLGIVFACIYASTGLKYAWILALGVINVLSGIAMQRALMVSCDSSPVN
jgi:hypothetical protein